MAKTSSTIEPKVQTITTLRRPTREKLDQMARQEGVSRSEIQRRAIEKFVQAAEKKGAAE